MTKITKQIVLDLIDTAKINGKSSKVKVVPEEMNYFRSLISQYNKQNNAKIKISKAYGEYREVQATFDRFFDLPDWKPAFDLIQAVLHSDQAKINPNQLKMIKNKLNVIVGKCENQCVEGGLGADIPTNVEKKEYPGTVKKTSVLS